MGGGRYLALEARGSMDSHGHVTCYLGESFHRRNPIRRAIHSMDAVVTTETKCATLAPSLHSLIIQHVQLGG